MFKYTHQVGPDGSRRDTVEFDEHFVAFTMALIRTALASLTIALGNSAAVPALVTWIQAHIDLAASLPVLVAWLQSHIGLPAPHLFAGWLHLIGTLLFRQ